MMIRLAAMPYMMRGSVGGDAQKGQPADHHDGAPDHRGEAGLGGRFLPKYPKDHRDEDRPGQDGVGHIQRHQHVLDPDGEGDGEGPQETKWQYVCISDIFPVVGIPEQKANEDVVGQERG